MRFWFYLMNHFKMKLIITQLCILLIIIEIYLMYNIYIFFVMLKNKTIFILIYFKYFQNIEFLFFYDWKQHTFVISLKKKNKNTNVFVTYISYFQLFTYKMIGVNLIENVKFIKSIIFCIKIDNYYNYETHNCNVHLLN